MARNTESKDESRWINVKPAILRTVGGLTMLAGLGIIGFGTNHYMDEMNSEAQAALHLDNRLNDVQNRLDQGEFVSEQEFALRLQETRLNKELSGVLDNQSTAGTNALTCLAVLGPGLTTIGAYVMFSSIMDEQ